MLRNLIESLKNRCAKGTTVKQIRVALLKLETWQFLACEGAKTGRIVTILNWSTYQDSNTDKGQTRGQRQGKDRATIKNVKNENKNNRKYIEVKMSEKTEQIAVVAWFNYQYKPAKIIAILNDQKYNDKKKNVFSIVAAAKKQGMIPGTSDLFIAKPVGRFSGMWLEMKDVNKQYKHVSENQRQFIKDMLEAGYYATYAFGFEQARQTIMNYMNGNQKYGTS